MRIANEMKYIKSDKSITKINVNNKAKESKIRASLRRNALYTMLNNNTIHV